MRRTFTYPLLPNKAQAAAIDAQIKECRVLYNAALQQRREAYSKQKKSFTLFDQKKELSALRAAEPEWRVNSRLLQVSALYRLDLAFKAFFRRVKSGEAPGFPRFKAFGRYSSFENACSSDDIRDDRFHIPKIGKVKFKKYRELKGRPTNFIVRKLYEGCYRLSISCDLGDAPQTKPATNPIGIDMGLSHFATLSNGEQIANPRFFKASQDELAVARRKLSRKKKGSKSRQRAKDYLKKLSMRVANRRTDFARKLAKQLFQSFDAIAIEDLNIKGLASGMLSKSINDAAWNVFFQALANKAEEAGLSLMKVDPKHTSQMCSGCGALVKKDLGVRWHSCPCGTELDRDHNAALNVLARSGLVGLCHGAAAAV